MYTNTNDMKHRCPDCYTTMPTKKIFDLHTTMCKFIHTSSYEHTIDKYYTDMELPSQEAMAHYLFHLTHKYQELEQKMAKLQKCVIPQRRKTIQEYLEQLAPPTQPFQEWLQQIKITDEALEILFKTDLKTAIKHVLDPFLFEIPLRAFSQKPNTFYLYDKQQEWHLMTSDEFSKMIDKIEHKFLRKYTTWATENSEELSKTQQAQERNIIYMSKVNGVKQSPRAPDIKKWLYSKIAVSLTQVTV